MVRMVAMMTIVHHYQIVILLPAAGMINRRPHFWNSGIRKIRYEPNLPHTLLTYTTKTFTTSINKVI